MSGVEVVSLKCPRCGHPLSDYDGSSPIVTCSECGEVIHVSGIATAKKEQEIAKILLFSVTQDQFEEKVENKLVNDENVPINVITNSSFRVNQYYVPVFVYDGSYEADYQYSRGYTETYYDKQGESHDKTVYYDERDSCKGSFRLTAPAFDISNESPVPNGVKKAVKKFSFNLGIAKNYSPSYLKGIDNLVVPKISREGDECWSADNLFKQVNDMAMKNITNRLDNLPDKSTLLGKKWKNMRADVNLSSCTFSVYLLPVWYAEYTYQDKIYHVVASGCGDGIEYTAPKTSSFDDVISEHLKTIWRPIFITGAACLAVLGLILYFLDGGVSAWPIVAGVGFSLLWIIIVAWCRSNRVDKIRSSYIKQRKRVLQKLRQGGTLSEEDTKVAYRNEDYLTKRNVFIVVTIVINILIGILVYYYMIYVDLSMTSFNLMKSGLLGLMV